MTLTYHFTNFHLIYYNQCYHYSVGGLFAGQRLAVNDQIKVNFLVL